MKKSIYTISTHYSLDKITKGKYTLTMERSNLTSPVREQINIMYHSIIHREFLAKKFTFNQLRKKQSDKSKWRDILGNDLIVNITIKQHINVMKDQEVA